MVPNLYSFLTVSDKPEKDENKDILSNEINKGKLKVVNGSSDTTIKSNNNIKYHSINNNMCQNKENHLELI